MLFYWQSQRGNFYLDELFCFGYAHSFTTGEYQLITDSPEWEYNKWIDVEELQGLLRVGDEESLEKQPIKEQLTLLTQKRTYYGLLNYIMYDSGENASFYRYAWGALLLNIWFFLVSEVLMAYCIRELTHRDDLMVLSIIMFGFSAIIMGMCEYIRFYMLTIMLLLVVICCHLKIWKDRNVLKCFVLELTAFVTAYIALMHSELMLVTCGSLFVFFFVGLLCCKRFKQAAIYAAPLLYGTYRYVVLRTNLLDIVLHPANYVGPGSGTEMVTRALLSWTPERGWEIAKRIHSIIADKWFGNGFVMVAFIVLIISLLSLKSSAHTERADDDLAERNGFVIVLMMSAFMSYLFNLLTGLYLDRYSSFLIVLLTIILWSLISYVPKGDRKGLSIALIAMLTIAAAGFCQQGEKYPFLYVNDTAGKVVSEEAYDVDSITFYNGASSYIGYWAMYDLVANVEDGTKLYVFEPGHDPDPEDIEPMPETFLAWLAIDGSNEQLIRALENDDYQMKSIGKTWQNEVFLCSKR